MATIDQSGATIKTLNSYLEDVRAAYLAIDAAWNISPESPDGNSIEIWSELLANLDEAVVAAYQAIDPRVAVGQQLDRIAALNRLTRQAGTFSTATVQLTGTAGTVVPAGTEFRNSETGTLWASDTDVTLDGSGDGEVNVTCTTAGPEPAAIGSIDTIATPVGGLSSVDNADAASLGTDEETDTAFRIRRNESVGRPGNNQVESMFASVADVSGVNRARIYENFTGITDSNGLNPHSLAVIVDGGDVEDIAQAMAIRKNPGTNLNRDNGSIDNEVTESTITPEGTQIAMTFFRPLLTTIHVRVEVVGTFDADDVKDAIVSYSKGELLDDVTGFDRTGFDIGDDVPVGKLFTPVNRTLATGAFAESITIGTSAGSLGSSTITIPFNGLAVFDVGSIEVVAA